MKLEKKKIGNVNIVYLPPGMKTTTSDTIEKKLVDIIDNDVDAHMLINLKDIGSITISGLRIFLTVRKKLNEMNKVLKICEINNPVVKESFYITDLFKLLQFSETEEEGLKSFVL